MPLYITATVLLFAALIHIYSRKQASRPHAEGRHSRLDTALVEQIEAMTYDARVKLGASYNDPDHVSKNFGTLFFDDVAVERVNDGSYSLAYAPAVDQESALKLFPRLWPWPRFIHGQIVRELAAQGATAVGFDVMFPEFLET